MASIPVQCSFLWLQYQVPQNVHQADIGDYSSLPGPPKYSKQLPTYPLFGFWSMCEAPLGHPALRRRLAAPLEADLAASEDFNYSKAGYAPKT